MKHLILLIAAVFVAAGCDCYKVGQSNDFEPRPGDLLFQDGNCGQLCDAIKRVTSGYDNRDYSHVGIAARENGRLVVIEAGGGGVKVTDLETFLGKSVNDKNQPKVEVGRLKKPYRKLISAALDQAYGLVGKPYDKEFVIGNDAYYCSELIYEIFLRANGDNPLFKLEPMTFKVPQDTAIDPVWQEYFNKLGEDVPEGEPGINPGTMSRANVLDIIYSYRSQ